MARFGMVIDLERCTGCYSCVIACKQYFGTAPGVDYNQGSFVEWGEHPSAHRRYVSTMCNHCEQPPCMTSCSFGATSKSPEGPVLTDPAKCTGCGECVGACPYGQRFIAKPGEHAAFPNQPIPAEEEALRTRAGKAEKCTLCQERLAKGLEPACTAMCPGQCRVFGDLDDPESEINYYIKLYGAIKIAGTSLYYVLPEGMDPAVLPPGFGEDGSLRTTTAADAVGKRLQAGDVCYREARDGLLKVRDVIRTNSSEPPEGGGEYRYSYCSQCNHMPKCGVKALVRDGKVLRLERRERYGNELPCALGNAATQDLYAPDRLLHPLRRTNKKGERSQWRQLSWDEALAEIAAKLNAVAAEHGPEQVLFMTGDVKEPKSALQRLCYSFGSPHFATESSTCFNAAELAVRLVLGTESQAVTSLVPGPPPDINDTKVALIWANNPGTSAAFAYDRMKTTREYSSIKYIVVDPRVTSTTENFADVHIQLRPGTDGALALFFADQLISRGAYDKQFVSEWAHGFEEYRELAARYDLVATSRITGVAPEKLMEAADILVEGGSPITIKSSSTFPHHSNGTDNYRAMFLLVALTGSLDVEGGCLIANEPLSIDMWGGSYAFARAHELMPALDELRLDRADFPVWADADRDGCFQVNKLPEYVAAGKLRAAVLLGVNTMMWPQTHLYQKAFRDMEFVAAADFRERPATHDYVDMLLPAAMPLERSAPLAQVGRKLFLREAAVRPRGEARSDYRICADIGTALGLGSLFWGGGEGAEEQMLREVLRSAGGSVQPTLEELREATPDGVAIPLAGGVKYRKWELGLLREDGKPGFSTPSGKVEFASEYLRERGFEPLPLYREPHQSPVSTPELAEEFPLILSSGARVPFFCHSLNREQPWLVRYMPEPTINLGAADARARGLADGDYVRITSPANRKGIVAKLAVTNTLYPGMAEMHHGWPQADVNELISRVFDPISGFPAYREGLCQIALEASSKPRM